MALKVDLQQMVQTNSKTGWQRDVRCFTAPNPSPEGEWEWQDEHGGWNVYASAVQRLLTACGACGVRKCEFEAVGRHYQVEAGKQINMETRVQRTVRQQASNGSNADGKRL